MLPIVASLLRVQTPPAIQRDAYGVPHIKAATVDEAFFHAGYAVAEDRLWQMENSRRAARGKLAEIYGARMVPSDREVLLTGYTDDELRQQFEKLSPAAKAAFLNYTKGVNAYIAAAKSADKLPAGYKELGFEPEPWSELDSAAIGIRLFQQFGRGGAGEIRNLALLGYLQTQPNSKARALDVFDDLAWWNDPASPTTILPEDDPLAKTQHPFSQPSRAVTEKHLSLIPKVNLLELLPGVRLASLERSTRAAEILATPFKAGSYAVVVSPSRSATGEAILLSAPQMGFTSPSIVHEMSIEAPGLKVVGMDVPGAPGVVIGFTPDLAWGLTSGVADTDDIYFHSFDGDTYTINGKSEPIQTIKRTLKVKGEADQEVEQKRTQYGPIVVASASAKTLFARRSSYRMREMESFEAVLGLYGAKTPDEVDRSLDKATMSFNFFYATRAGDIGYRYVGLVPVRSSSGDPRLPLPATADFDWKGYVPTAQMPRVRNPKAGLITNWNNKPAAWWPNGDTPAWGRIFRVSVLRSALESPKLNVQDVEMAAWRIARTDPSFPFFAPFLTKLQGNPYASAQLRAYDGRTLEGSIGATLYNAWIDALREEVFLGTTGNLLTPDNFRMAVQPSVLIAALEGKTKVNYLGGRKPQELATAALAKAVERVRAARGENVGDWGFRPGGMAVPNQPPIPYSDRGTYIQIVQLGQSVYGRNVLPPGVAESGPASLNQAPLARAWQYKAMRFWTEPKE